MGKRWLLFLLFLILLNAGSSNAQTDRPGLRPLLEVFVTQLDLAIQQAAFAAFSTTLHDIQVQNRQVLNIAVGEADASFDSAVPNLGDGIGLLSYTRRIARFMEENPQFEAYKVTVDNIRFFVQASTELLKVTLRLHEPEAARRQVRIAQGLLLAARGAPGDLPSEGGVRTLLSLLVD